MIIPNFPRISDYVYHYANKLPQRDALVFGDLHIKYKKSVVQEITKDNLGFRFDHTLISSGDPFNSSYSPEYKVTNGDVIFIDCGVVVKDYSSDMARTFVVGKPSP